MFQALKRFGWVALIIIPLSLGLVGILPMQAAAQLSGALLFLMLITMLIWILGSIVIMGFAQLIDSIS